jgi:hypothetical protein
VHGFSNAALEMAGTRLASRWIRRGSPSGRRLAVASTSFAGAAEVKETTKAPVAFWVANGSVDGKSAKTIEAEFSQH